MLFFSVQNLRLSPDVWKEKVKSKRLCFNCLSGEHTVTQCHSRRRCKRCQSRHHTLLHRDEQTSPTLDEEEHTMLAFLEQCWQVHQLAVTGRSAGHHSIQEPCSNLLHPSWLIPLGPNGFTTHQSPSPVLGERSIAPIKLNYI